MNEPALTTGKVTNLGLLGTGGIYVIAEQALRLGSPKLTLKNRSVPVRASNLYMAMQFINREMGLLGRIRVPAVVCKIMEGAVVTGLPILDNQAASAATTVEDLVTDFNALLTKLKTAGLMISD